IPIIDIRLRMGKPSIAYTNVSCIIVFQINSIPIGIIVDSVAQVLDIDCSKITPVPSNNQQELVNRMTSFNEKEAILLLDCEQLVNN
ncbi:MAG: chemotaxis protein CheW, partial [Lachnospiraceae bacterium]